MSIETDVKKKLETLFKEEDNFAEQYFTKESKFAMEDMTPQEKAEVELALKELHSKLPSQPKKTWRWSFFGRLLLKAMFYLFEFVIWVLLIKFALSTTINKDITWLQSINGALILSYFRFWWK